MKINHLHTLTTSLPGTSGAECLAEENVVDFKGFGFSKCLTVLVVEQRETAGLVITSSPVSQYYNFDTLKKRLGLITNIANVIKLKT